MEAHGVRLRSLALASMVAAFAACARADHTPPPGASTVATPAPGPSNAPLTDIGTPRGIPLDPEQIAAVNATERNVPAARRAHLRYALALGDDGKRHLVVYDDGAPAKRSPHDYVVPKALNLSDDSHYDPTQNELIAPIAPPKERDYTYAR